MPACAQCTGLYGILQTFIGLCKPCMPAQRMTDIFSAHYAGWTDVGFEIIPKEQRAANGGTYFCFTVILVLDKCSMCASLRVREPKRK